MGFSRCCPNYRGEESDFFFFYLTYERIHKCIGNYTTKQQTHLENMFLLQINLKGKFSSGIEGALASTLNRNFNWKQLSEMTLGILFWMFFKVYLSDIDSETAEI